MKVLFEVIEHLDPVRVARADVFARKVATLNRNRNAYGNEHAEVAVVTDQLPFIQFHDQSVEDGDTGTSVGLCWSGGHFTRPNTLIWLSPFTVLGGQYDTQLRGKVSLTLTLTHELAHAYTRGQHSYTWRRMFALLLPGITKLFEVEYRDAYVYDAVNKYAVQSYYARRSAEASEHLWAQERMKKRLVKHGIWP